MKHASCFLPRISRFPLSLSDLFDWTETIVFLAKDKKFDVVLVDTAGRMQNDEPLMIALAKVMLRLFLRFFAHWRHCCSWSMWTILIWFYSLAKHWLVTRPSIKWRNSIRHCSTTLDCRRVLVSLTGLFWPSSIPSMTKWAQLSPWRTQRISRLFSLALVKSIRIWKRSMPTWLQKHCWNNCTKELPNLEIWPQTSVDLVMARSRLSISFPDHSSLSVLYFVSVFSLFLLDVVSSFGSFMPIAINYFYSVNAERLDFFRGGREMEHPRASSI